MTAPAEASGLSQPAISAQVKALERHYGTRLIERDARGSTPTEAGRLVADYAARALALVDELGRGIADLEGLGSGELVVGASSTVGTRAVGRSERRGAAGGWAALDEAPGIGPAA